MSWIYKNSCLSSNILVCSSACLSLSFFIYIYVCVCVCVWVFLTPMIRCIPFPWVWESCKIQPASSRIWTRAARSISGFFLSIYLSITVCLYLSIDQFQTVHICLSVCLSLFISVSVCSYLSIYIYIYIYIYSERRRQKETGGEGGG